MSILVLSFLGHPSIEHDGDGVELTFRKATALLAFLAVEGGRPSRDELSEMLFPRQERDRALANLRQAIAVLRGNVGDHLGADKAAVWLVEGPDVRVDACEFPRLLAAAAAADRAGSPADAERTTAEAVHLVRGEFLAGFYLRDSPGFEQWQQAKRDTLREDLVGALVRLAAWCAGRGDLPAAVTWARKRLSTEPLEEAAHRDLMRLQAMSGDRAAALRQYERCRETLRKDLGVGPDRSTEELHNNIEDGRLAVTAQSVPPTGGRQAKPPRPGNLPYQATTFVGREAELAAVLKALRRPDVRLLTLTGPGGTGKTRLALEAASREARRFEHGAFFVDLAPLHDPDHFAAATAAGLGGVYQEITAGRSLTDVVRDYLRTRHVLLVLDNFEHLLTAAPEVAGLLAACPKLKVLATSREPLRLRAEHELPVQPLALPQAGETITGLSRSESIQLFAERAAAVMPGFAVTVDTAATIAGICRRLDGLPLAIELAAARTRAVPLPRLLEQLQHRLRVLTDGPRDLPDRQRTMRDEIRWSVELLSEDERLLFRRLAVFVGGCSADGAEAVCPEKADAGLHNMEEILASLASKSLIRQQVESGRPRFHMLQVIREYAREELETSGEARPATCRFAAHFLDLAERAESFLRGPDQAFWFARLEAEDENLREALSWFRESGAIAEGLRLAGALGWFWFRRARFAEGYAWLNTFHTAARPDHPTGARAKVAYFLGWMHRVVGDRYRTNHKAAELFRESLALWREADDRCGIALALAGIGRNAGTLDPNESEDVREVWAAPLRESMREARATGNPWTIGWCLREAMAELILWEHDDPLPRDDLEEALRNGEAAGDPFLIRQTRLGMGEALLKRNDHGAAEPWLLGALQDARECDDTWSTFDALNLVAENYFYWNRMDEAKHCWGEALRLAIDLGVKGFVHWYIGGLDWIARKEGRMERAALLRAAAVRGVLPDIEYMDDRGSHGPPLVIDEATDRQRWALARTMSIDQIRDYALSDED